MIAYIGFGKLQRSDFYENVSAKDKVQVININQLKLKVNYTYKNDQNLSTNFKPSTDEDVINKTYPATILSKLEGQIYQIEKG